MVAVSNQYFVGRPLASVKTMQTRSDSISVNILKIQTPAWVYTYRHTSILKCIFCASGNGIQNNFTSNLHSVPTV